MIRHNHLTRIDLCQVSHVWVFYKWDYAYDVGNHCHRVNLCHTLYTVQKNGHSIPVLKNEQWPVTISVKEKAISGRPWITDFPQNSDLIDLVEHVFVSTRKNPQSSVVEFPPQLDSTLWTALSITALSPVHSCSSWHSMVAYGPMTFSTILSKRCFEVFSNPTRSTPVCFSNVIRRTYIYTYYDSHVRLPLAILLTKFILPLFSNPLLELPSLYLSGLKPPNFSAGLIWLHPPWCWQE